jgi:hypothetical protein
VANFSTQWLSPVAALTLPVQVSPVLAVTVTGPVGWYELTLKSTMVETVPFFGS